MNLEECASVWLEELKRLLANHPDTVLVVEKMVEEKRYKEAFSTVQDTIADMKIKLDDDFKKADEDLYWSLS